MRVCLVSRRYWPAVSGMSVYAENLLRELVARGHEPTLISQHRDDPTGVAIYGGGPPPPERVPAGVAVRPRPSRGETVTPADFEADTADLVATIEAAHADPATGPFDVLHAQYGYPPGLAVLLAGRRLGLPTVTSIQGGDGHWVGTCCATHARAIRTVLVHSGATLIGSASFRDEVVGHHGTDPSRFTIVPGATDTTRFTPDPDRASGSTLLFHGRLDRRKGLLDLLDALPLLREPWRLIVSGLGPDADELAGRVAADPLLRGRVELRGAVAYDEAPGVYRDADIFVSPTHSEGFSNTILEAMASGCAVVSTASIGVVDAVTDGVDGLLVPVGDVEALAAALDRLLADRDLRTRLAETALATVRERYSWPVLATTIEDVYEAVRAAPLDHDWPADPVGEVDLDCRFRRTPHLL